MIIPPFTNTVIQEIPGGRTEYFGLADHLWAFDNQMYGCAAIIRTRVETRPVSHLRLWPPGIIHTPEEVETERTEFETGYTRFNHAQVLFNLNGVPWTKSKFYFGYRGALAHNAWQRHGVKLSDELLEQIFAPIDKQITAYYHEWTKKPQTLEEFSRELQ